MLYDTAIDFISTLKASHQEMIREIEILRHELDGYRQGMPFPPGGGVVYGHPPVGVPPFAHPPGPGVPPPSTHSQPPTNVQNTPQSSLVQPGSSQNVYSPPRSPQPQTPAQNITHNTKALGSADRHSDVVSLYSRNITCIDIIRYLWSRQLVVSITIRPDLHRGALMARSHMDLLTCEFGWHFGVLRPMR